MSHYESPFCLMFKADSSKKVCRRSQTQGTCWTVAFYKYESYRIWKESLSLKRDRQLLTPKKEYLLFSVLWVDQCVKWNLVQLWEGSFASCSHKRDDWVLLKDASTFSDSDIGGSTELEDFLLSEQQRSCRGLFFLRIGTFLSFRGGCRGLFFDPSAGP